MRRPRSKLEVSTFPFLAVLLCAMGSLLLFLFIMDRRAKIVAQNHAAQSHPGLVARKPDTPAAQDLRQKEWEEAREKLHRLLLEEQQQVISESQGVQNNLTETNTKLHLIQTRYLDAQQQLASETAKILALQDQVERERKGIQSTDVKQTASKSELTSASQQLLELQTAYHLLKAQRDQDKEVYSLVPYRGKRGDLRPPIYVECCREGLVFHPEKKLLNALNFSAAALVGEIERQIGAPLAVEKPARDKDRSRLVQDEKKGPYVLFLVRPEGINNYYKALGTLRNYQLDFGYELVDEQWALDFSGNSPAGDKSLPPGLAPKQFPGLPTEIGPPAFPGTSNNPTGGGPGPIEPPGSLPPLPGSLAGGTGLPGTGPGTGIPGTGGPYPLTGDPAAGGSGLGTGGLGTGLPGTGNPGTGIPGTGNPGTGIPGVGGPNGGTSNVGMPNSGAPGTGIGLGSGTAGREPSFVPLPKDVPMIPIASAGSPGTPGVIASAGTPAQPGNGSGQPNSNGSGQPNSNGENIPPVSAPIPGNRVAQHSGNPNAAGATDGSTGTGNQTGSGGGVPTGSDPGPAYNRSVLPSQLASGQAQKPAPAPGSSKLIGNRDFVITIDCYSDYVNVFPGGMKFRWTAQNMQMVDQSLVQHVARLAERRQASVRPGEPPYRPMIRFQVSPEGLRSYYHAYPLLENLRIPMTRENVED